MASTYDAVFFDLDATLLDTEQIVEDSIQEVLRVHHQVEFSESEMEAIRGLPDLGPGSWSDLAIRRFGLQNVATEEKLNEQVYQIVDENIENCAAMPGAAKVVTALAAAGVPIGLVTSSREESMYLKIRKHSHIFRHMRIFIPVEHVEPLSKPHPNCYLLAAERLNVDITRCLVVEDSVVGAAAGIAAGANVISVPQSHHIEAVRGLGVQHIFPSLEQWDLRQFFPQQFNDNFDAYMKYQGDDMHYILEKCLMRSIAITSDNTDPSVYASSSDPLVDVSSLSTPLPPPPSNTVS